MHKKQNLLTLFNKDLILTINYRNIEDFSKLAILISKMQSLALNFFWSPQSQFRNLKEALPQSQFRNFLKKCCSATAIPQSQFFLMSATSNPQLESFISAIFGIFLAVESGWGS
jgi:hypothetical protein